MEIGCDCEGAMYLATMTMAFPDEDWQMRMPPYAGAVCHENGIVQIVLFTVRSRLIPISPLPSAASVAEADQQFIRENNPCTVP